MIKNKIHKMLAVLLVFMLLVVSMVACSSKPKEVNALTGSYDEMVEYLTEKGYISKDAKPVNINETKGYLTDNTGGEFTETHIADKANDYDGLWLFWWDQENQSDYYAVYNDMKVNAGTILLGGGAAMLPTSAQNGAFAIAFSEDFANKDAVIADFKGLSNSK